jgi:DNA-binding LacI/PurR family transcriptional regulator
MTRTQSSEKKPKLDIRTVASLAKVSIATVSRTINGISTVDPVLSARVWRAVEQLNYFPNRQARALVSGRSRLLGLIISDITNPFFPELIREFENVAVEHGYDILIGSTNYELKRTQTCVRRMLERQVDGVAILTFGIEELLLDRFAVGDVPMIFIDAGPLLPRSSILTVDYQNGIFEGVQHLAVLGHRKIAFISGPLKLKSAEIRKAAFVKSMTSIGLKSQDEWFVEGDHTLDGGRDAMEKLLTLSNRPTAIMCSNDLTAIGVLHAVFDANLCVPDDFSLVGFDDVHLAEYTIPPLTTVRMSCKDLAYSAVLNLLAHIDATQIPYAPTLRIPTRLIVRQTTGLPISALGDLVSTADLETHKNTRRKNSSS